MPTASAARQAFARAEAKLREEIAAAEAAAERAQEKRAAALARLEELLRVKEFVVAEAPAKKNAAQTKPKRPAAPAKPRAQKGLPEAGTATRTVLDAIVAGARHYREIRERTGFPTTKIGGIVPGLVKRGLVVRVGGDDYAPTDAAK